MDLDQDCRTLLALKVQCEMFIRDLETLLIIDCNMFQNVSITTNTGITSICSGIHVDWIWPDFYVASGKIVFRMITSLNKGNEEKVCSV